jgi:hypothetical protein
LDLLSPEEAAEMEGLVQRARGLAASAQTRLRGRAADLDAEVAARAAETRALAGAFGVLRGVLPRHACPVCLGADVAAYLDPCGHTFCAGCAARACSSARCFLCRAGADRARPLFL